LYAGFPSGAEPGIGGLAGAFWVGSALMIALVILPGVRKAGPGSERALPMAQISQAMGLSSLLTTLAGLLL
jgi:hypothetical protein